MTTEEYNILKAVKELLPDLVYAQDKAFDAGWLEGVKDCKAVIDKQLSVYTPAPNKRLK
jgi:hypothetical protein